MDSSENIYARLDELANEALTSPSLKDNLLCSYNLLFSRTSSEKNSPWKELQLKKDPATKNHIISYQLVSTQATTSKFSGSIIVEGDKMGYEDF